MSSTSHIIIHKGALENNIAFIRSMLGEKTRISAVIKGNAYGHGISVMIPALEKLGIRHFSVYSSPEAKEAFAVKSSQSTLMIMGFIYPGDLDWIIRNKVEYYVSELPVLEQSISIARLLKARAFIHIDVETGMYRTGLTMSQLIKAVQLIYQNRKYVEVRGIASHFAGAESIANHKRVKNQYSIFNKRIRFLQDQGISPELRHIASSAAMVNYPESRLDLVRTGIMIYGYWPTRETFINYIHKRKDKSDPLKRALSWYSSVMLIKEVPEGEFIGYGLSYQASHRMKIMVVPVGYCNGYSRSMSNNSHVIVQGQRSQVIGIVNMNMIICDITDIPGVKTGDPITLIGKQGDLEISFSSFAEMNNSLNYEILARLPENISREITEE